METYAQLHNRVVNNRIEHIRYMQTTDTLLDWARYYEPIFRPIPSDRDFKGCSVEDSITKYVLRNIDAIKNDDIVMPRDVYEGIRFYRP